MPKPLIRLPDGSWLDPDLIKSVEAEDSPSLPNSLWSPAFVVVTEYDGTRYYADYADFDQACDVRNEFATRLNLLRAEPVEPAPDKPTDLLAARAAGGDAWDKIPDVEAFLNGGTDGDISPHLRERLIFNFDVSETSPVVKGTWVTAAHVVSLLVDGWSWSDVLRAHPELTEDDLRACLAYTVETEDHPRLGTATPTDGAIL